MENRRRKEKENKSGGGGEREREREREKRCFVTLRHPLSCKVALHLVHCYFLCFAPCITAIFFFIGAPLISCSFALPFHFLLSVSVSSSSSSFLLLLFFCVFGVPRRRRRRRRRQARQHAPPRRPRPGGWRPPAPRRAWSAAPASRSWWAAPCAAARAGSRATCCGPARAPRLLHPRNEGEWGGQDAAVRLRQQRFCTRFGSQLTWSTRRAGRGWRHAGASPRPGHTPARARGEVPALVMVV